MRKIIHISSNRFCKMLCGSLIILNIGVIGLEAGGVFPLASAIAELVRWYYMVTWFLFTGWGQYQAFFGNLVSLFGYQNNCTRPSVNGPLINCSKMRLHSILHIFSHFRNSRFVFHAIATFYITGATWNKHLLSLTFPMELFIKGLTCDIKP